MTLLIRNFTKNKLNPRRLAKVEEIVLSSEKIKGETEISLVFTGNKRIRTLNQRYRGIDRATDVLSFEGEGKGFIEPEDGVRHLGEIFISYPKAVSQAREKGHTVAKEIDILLIHGLFHLLGYDHIRDEDYEVMHRKEESVIKKLYKR